MDAEIRRRADAGLTAYSEGDLKTAEIRYRQALRRAWSLDDPLESAHAAHNLAACLVSSGDLDQARSWALEARYEFERARRKDANNVLLEAKIARKMNSLEEARRLADEAERIVECCDAEPALCPPPAKECECECVEWYQWRKYREQKGVLERRANTTRAEVYLVRALLACDEGDTGAARSECRLACELLPDTCEPELRAELQRVLGSIDRLEGRYDRSARHFDTEAELLRRAQNYREIPLVLALAAEDYERAENRSLAADRWYRVARIHFARGDLNLASERFKHGFALAESANDSKTLDRFALLFRELDEAVSAKAKPAAPDAGAPDRPPVDASSESKNAPTTPEVAPSVDQSP